MLHECIILDPLYMHTTPTHCWELMKSVGSSLGSSWLLFTMKMKVSGSDTLWATVIRLWLHPFCCYLQSAVAEVSLPSHIYTYMRERERHCLWPESKSCWGPHVSSGNCGFNLDQLSNESCFSSGIAGKLFMKIFENAEQALKEQFNLKQRRTM
jgi:hypothetical protein